MIFPGFPGVVSFFQVFQVFQVEWEPWWSHAQSQKLYLYHRCERTHPGHVFHHFHDLTPFLRPRGHTLYGDRISEPLHIQVLVFVYVPKSHNNTLKVRLHQATAPTLRQYCNDPSGTAFIENNVVTPKWVATLFWSNSIVFNESSIASVIAVLSQRWRWRLVTSSVSVNHCDDARWNS